MYIMVVLFCKTTGRTFGIESGSFLVCVEVNECYLFNKIAKESNIRDKIPKFLVYLSIYIYIYFYDDLNSCLEQNRNMI